MDASDLPGFVDPANPKLLHLADGVAAAVGLTAPLWLQQFETWTGGALAAGALALMAIRIACAVRDFRRKGRDAP